MSKTPTSPVTPTFAPSTPCFLSSYYLTGDSVRDKCIEMVSAALKMDGERQNSHGLLTFGSERQLFKRWLGAKYGKQDKLKGIKWTVISAFRGLSSSSSWSSTLEHFQYFNPLGELGKFGREKQSSPLGFFAFALLCVNSLMATCKLGNQHMLYILGCYSSCLHWVWVWTGWSSRWLIPLLFLCLFQCLSECFLWVFQWLRLQS